MPAPLSSVDRRAGYHTGIVLCAISGVLFGLLGAFGTKAFAGGQSVSEVLMLRFGAAAVVLWVVVLITRRPLPTGRALVQAVALGAIGYAVQALLYFSALQLSGQVRLDLVGCCSGSVSRWSTPVTTSARTPCRRTPTGSPSRP